MAEAELKATQESDQKAALRGKDSKSSEPNKANQKGKSLRLEKL